MFIPPKSRVSPLGVFVFVFVPELSGFCWTGLLFVVWPGVVPLGGGGAGGLDGVHAENANTDTSNMPVIRILQLRAIFLLLSLFLKIF